VSREVSRTGASFPIDAYLRQTRGTHRSLQLAGLSTRVYGPAKALVMWLEPTRPWQANPVGILG
jgi:hypothetical protein